MRKQQQRQILELLQTIREAQAAGLYVDCQEGAIVVGEFIESVAGEGSKTVALLEGYCELLFKVSNGEIGERALNKQLVQIENSVKSELKPDRVEMVFLSYKASMSDSIESIFLAAKEDPSCDAYWIPVPYYDRKPDGSFGEMHFEGAECYGENIECTDWREYDIEARHPDVIFTFNPYDAGNYVTSIHPDYYCERLRSLTDLLVYVPYFVVTNDVPAHFVTIAGCMYAHRVIVQSDKARETYIRVFKEAYGDKFGNPKDKFIALGSPKFDKVINTKREDCALPDEWRELIGDKKVFFYNTVVGAILKFGDQYLKKVRYVLDTFRERSDVVLWWRPHPLNEATVASMRPELIEEYERIVKEYKSEAWGIYDDTPDLHRAVAFSDAYYGDSSSLVPMYLAAGKPVMIAKPEVLQNDVNFEPTCLYVSDDSMWFCVRHINALFKMSRTELKLEFAGSFPGEDDYTTKHNNSLYHTPVEKDGVLYFPPFLAKEIAAYSIEDKSFEKIKYEAETNDRRNFIGAVVFGDYVFFTPFTYPAILRLNVKTGETGYFSDWLEPLMKLTGNVPVELLTRPTVAGSSMYFAAREANAVLEFNMETCESAIYEVGKKEYRYNKLCFDGKNFWLPPRYDTKTPVIKWNPQGGVLKKFHEIYTDENDNGYKIVCGGGYIRLLPVMASHSFKIDMHTDTIYRADEFNQIASPGETESTTRKYSLAQMYGDSVFAFEQQSRKLIEYNCMTKEHREKVINYNPKTIAKLDPMLAQSMQKDACDINAIIDCYYRESGRDRLSCYIEYVSGTLDSRDSESKKRRMEIIQAENTNADGTAGEAVYRCVKA